MCTCVSYDVVSVENKNPSFLQAYPVLVMEMLEGGDLFSRIASRTGVTEHYLAVSFLSAVKALQSIHERGFIHRDLKLDNIMCLDSGDPTEVKIIDFGMMIGVYVLKNIVLLLLYMLLKVFRVMWSMLPLLSCMKYF